MEILFISLVCAISYVVILVKILGLKLLAKTQIIWDIIFTFGMPFLFVGTYSGMSTAFISGVLFSLMTYCISFLVKLERKSNVSLRDDATTHSQNNGRHSSSLRSGRCTMCNSASSVQSYQK